MAITTLNPAANAFQTMLMSLPEDEVHRHEWVEDDLLLGRAKEHKAALDTGLFFGAHSVTAHGGGRIVRAGDVVRHRGTGEMFTITTAPRWVVGVDGVTRCRCGFEVKAGMSWVAERAAKNAHQETCRG